MSWEREPAPPKSAPSKAPGSEVPAVNERVTNKDDTNTEEQNANPSADKPASRRVNPHKYLLYRPTFSQLLVYIATAFKVIIWPNLFPVNSNIWIYLFGFIISKEINENSALLLYISADGAKRSNEQTSYNG